mmetsp:Transcript_14810/g.26895  ORF Transcript_14810/g.26895 Transcript_14810/m.26895 type:complete len:937 (+) Transcript_14810:53-2863(+)
MSETDVVPSTTTSAAAEDALHAAAAVDGQEATPSVAPTTAHQEQQQTPHSGGTLKHQIAEPPRWRFVDSAKKSLGYSSTAAGTTVQGLSAEELGAKYQAPVVEEVAPRQEKDGDVEIGKVAVPSFLEDGTPAEVQEVMAPRMRLSQQQPADTQASAVGNDRRKSTSDAHIDGQEEIQQQQHFAQLQELQTQTDKMQQEHTRLRVDILEAERKKETLERETQVVRDEKERIVQEKDEENGAVTAVAPLPVIASTGPIAAAGDDEDANNDETSDKRRRYKSWGMCALIAILLCAVAALLGVMLSGTSINGNTNNGDDPSNFRGVNDTVTGETTKPTLAPTTSKSRLPTITLPPTALSTEVPLLLISTEPFELLICPNNSKKFDLTIQLGQNPSETTWIILDKCTFETFYRCVRCYVESPPNYPVAYAGCLPSYNNETGEGREYVLQMVNIEDGPSSGYVLRYDDEIIVEVEKGEVTNLQMNHFGEGGGCSEAPSEVLLPTKSPTKLPTISTPYPTIELGIDDKPGCTPFLDDTMGTCGREPDVEFKLLMLSGMGALNNRLFGSSVTFVGDTGQIVAVGSGVGNSAVHIYSKPADPHLSDWKYLTAISLPSQETASVLFGASLDSNDEGYIVVGAPSLGGDDQSGMAFVYRPNSDLTDWALVAKLTPSGDGTLAPSFGISVSFDGNLIAVGSPDENGKGSVYVFEKTGNSWSESVKLSPDAVADGAFFGSSVSLYGDTPATLAVGAPRDTGGGSAFVYKRSDFDWLPQKLTPRDVEEGDDFGSSVVISGCSIAVSSPNDVTKSTTGTGTVRIFNWDADGDYWALAQIVEPNDELSGEIFGQCIAMEGNTLLVGSPSGGEGGEQSGVIYHFERIGGLWTKISVIPNKDYVSGDEESFGCPLDLSGDLFVSGSRGDSTLGPFSGSAYIFDLCPDVLQMNPS